MITDKVEKARKYGVRIMSIPEFFKEYNIQVTEF